MAQYRVALVQNESEMLRYGWADIRPLLANIDYSWISFTSEHIADLFVELKLGRYDAIVIATNAYNDELVRRTFQSSENKSIVQAFLQDGGGIYVSFQSRLAVDIDAGLEFLPNRAEIKFTNRTEAGTEGHLIIPRDYSEHFLFRSPSVISIDEVVSQCLHNEFVKSLYRGYLILPDENIYDEILIDDAYPTRRPLIVCSRSDFNGRIVVASIPLDWQSHQHLLENVIHFVVRGQPHIAIIEKQGTTTFDFKYLTSNLEVTKVPFNKYTQNSLDFGKIPFNIHNTVILDPAWTLDELRDSNYSKFLEHFESGARLFFFGAINANSPVVSYVGGLRSVHLILPSSVAWLRSQYQGGRWGGSFWQTYDVLDAFHRLGISISEYRSEVLDGIEKSIINGSYMEVMGATCAMLKLQYWFEGVANTRFRTTMNWIRSKYPDSSFYEQASAIDTLNDVGCPLPPDETASFRSKAVTIFASLDNELRIYRFAKTLLSCGYVDDSQKMCRKLAKFQSDSGTWINTTRTASMLTLLLDLQAKIERSDPLIDEMIFRGITALKSRYDHRNGNWGSDVPATAKSLQVVVQFERRVSLPIDELIQILQRFEITSHRFEVIDTAISLNTRLQKEKSELKLAVREREHIASRSARLATIVSMISAPLIALMMLLLFHSIQNRVFLSFWAYFVRFLNDWTLTISSTLVLIPIIALYLILRTFNRIPKVNLIPDEWEETILRRLGLTGNKDGSSSQK